MAVGRMTPYLLSQFVGTPGGSSITVPQLADIPMWFGMCFADPFTVGDPLTVEILGDGYDRPDAVWDSYGDTGLVTLEETAFLSLPVGTLGVAIALFDADVNGNMLAAANLDPGDYIDLPDGGAWIMPAGEFFLGFDLVGI